MVGGWEDIRWKYRSAQALLGSRCDRQKDKFKDNIDTLSLEQLAEK